MLSVHISRSIISQCTCHACTYFLYIVRHKFHRKPCCISSVSSVLQLYKMATTWTDVTIIFFLTEYYHPLLILGTRAIIPGLHTAVWPLYLASYLSPFCDALNARNKHLAYQYPVLVYALHAPLINDYTITCDCGTYDDIRLLFQLDCCLHNFATCDAIDACVRIQDPALHTLTFVWG